MSVIAFGPHSDEDHSRAVWRGATQVGIARQIDGPGTSWAFRASTASPEADELANQSWDSLSDLGIDVASALKRAASTRSLDTPDRMC